MAHALKQSRAELEDDSLDSSRLSRQTLADVDGDGKSETVIVDEYAGTANTLYFLYRSNRGCLHYEGLAWEKADFGEAAPKLKSLLARRFANAPTPKR